MKISHLCYHEDNHNLNGAAIFYMVLNNVCYLFGHQLVQCDFVSIVKDSKVV